MPNAEEMVPVTRRRSDFYVSHVNRAFTKEKARKCVNGDARTRKIREFDRRTTIVAVQLADRAMSLVDRVAHRYDLVQKTRLDYFAGHELKSLVHVLVDELLEYDLYSSEHTSLLHRIVRAAVRRSLMLLRTDQMPNMA